MMSTTTFNLQRAYKALASVIYNQYLFTKAFCIIVNVRLVMISNKIFIYRRGSRIYSHLLCLHVYKTNRRNVKENFNRI